MAGPACSDTLGSVAPPASNEVRQGTTIWWVNCQHIQLLLSPSDKRTLRKPEATASQHYTKGWYHRTPAAVKATRHTGHQRGVSEQGRTLTALLLT